MLKADRDGGMCLHEDRSDTMVPLNFRMKFRRAAVCWQRPAVRRSIQAGRTCSSEMKVELREKTSVLGPHSHVSEGSDQRVANFGRRPQRRLVVISGWLSSKEYGFKVGGGVVLVLVLPWLEARAPQRRSRVVRCRKNG